MWPRQTGGALLLAEGFTPSIWLEEDGAGGTSDSQVCVPAPDLSQRFDRLTVLLQITGDSALGSSRAALLKRAGFHVLTVHEPDVLAGIDMWDIAVVLFCQTIRRERAIAISEYLSKLRTHPFTARVTFAPHLDHLAFDAVLSAPVDPKTLVREAARWKWELDAECGIP